MALEIRIKRAEEYSARQLAAEMLADAVGSAPEDIFFYRGENGKPLTNLTLHFNCSHSGGFVVCAVGEREVGVVSGADPSGAPPVGAGPHGGRAAVADLAPAGGAG